MYAVSEFGCRDTVHSSALYIPWECVRSVEKGVGFLSDDIDVESWIKRHQSELKVYPTIFDSRVEVHYPNKHFHYNLYDEIGRIVVEGEGESFKELQLENLHIGSYLLEIEGKRFKMLKIKD